MQWSFCYSFCYIGVTFVMAAVLRGDTTHDDVVIDLSTYAKAAHERNTLT